MPFMSGLGRARAAVGTRGAAAVRGVGGVMNRVLRGTAHGAPVPHILDPSPGVALVDPARVRIARAAARATASNTKVGRMTVGSGMAAGGLGMSNSPSPRGSYNPRRPVVPVPKNGRPV